MEAKDTRVSKLAEKDRRYVWHPMARLSQPGAPMMVAAGEGPGSRTRRATATWMGWRGSGTPTSATAARNWPRLHTSSSRSCPTTRSP